MLQVSVLAYPLGPPRTTAPERRARASLACGGQHPALPCKQALQPSPKLTLALCTTQPGWNYEEWEILCFIRMQFRRGEPWPSFCWSQPWPRRRRLSQGLLGTDPAAFNKDFFQFQISSRKTLSLSFSE